MTGSTPGSRRRTVALLIVAACLGGLVYYDYRDRTRPPEASAPAGTPETPTAAGNAAGDHWRRVIASREAIDRAYADAAIAYAEMAAGLRTFSLEAGDPRRALEGAIRDHVPGGVRISELLIGEPETLGTGVYELEARLKLAAASTASAFATLWDLGEPGYGLRWKSFRLQPRPEQSRIEIVGELSAVVVQAVE